jgi:hypothetical protein
MRKGNREGGGVQSICATLFIRFTILFSSFLKNEVWCFFFQISKCAPMRSFFVIFFLEGGRGSLKFSGGVFLFGPSNIGAQLI